MVPRKCPFRPRSSHIRRISGQNWKMDFLNHAKVDQVRVCGGLDETWVLCSCILVPGHQSAYLFADKRRCISSKRATNRAPKHHFCALDALFALIPGTKSIPYPRYRRTHHTAAVYKPLSKLNIDLLRCTSYTLDIGQICTYLVPFRHCLLLFGIF